MTIPIVAQAWQYERLQQFVKFCLVGASGLFVDMGVLFLLADPRCLGLSVTLSKICSAEAALTSNFVWNELWTFRASSAALTLQRFNASTGTQPSTLNSQHLRLLLNRFLAFNAICGIGIGFAVLLLKLFHACFGWNLYLANLLAIGMVTLWNFGMNAHFNWHVGH